MLPKQYLRPVIMMALAIGVIAAPAAARPPLDPGQPPVHVTIGSAGPAQRSSDETDAARVRARSQQLANHVPPSGRISTAAAGDSPAIRLVTVTPPSDGFDWGDAAIGAAATAAIALLIAAGGVAMRQRHQASGIAS